LRQEWVSKLNKGRVQAAMQRPQPEHLTVSTKAILEIFAMMTGLYSRRNSAALLSSGAMNEFCSQPSVNGPSLRLVVLPPAPSGVDVPLLVL
jgi:hypothetical protein